MNSDDFKVAIANLPLVDNHCHFFSASYQSHDLAKALSISREEMPPEQLRNTMVYRLLLRELGRFLDIPDASERELLAERRRRMSEDYRAWVEALFTEGGIEALVLDEGYLPAAQPRDSFEVVAHCRVHYLLRMENLLDPLWEAFRQGSRDFKSVESRYFTSLAEALDGKGIVGLKSIIGYRTGLEVAPVERSELLGCKASEKQFRDYFFFETMRRVTGRGLPVQIHAGFGESHIDVRRNHPGMLKFIFEQADFRDLKFVLVHGGYPRSFEAGYLASIYPNVYVDLSEMIPFVPLGARQGVLDIMSMCPLNKILYGSDGFGIPEIHWLGAKLGREIIGGIMADFVEMGLFDHDGAVEAARLIFADNARKLYGLVHRPAASKLSLVRRGGE